MILHAEIGAAVGDEHVEFLERAFVEQQIDTLPCGELAATVLRIDPCLTAAQTRIFAAPLQLFENVFHDAPLL